MIGPKLRGGGMSYKDRNIEKLQAIGAAISEAKQFLKKAKVAHKALVSEEESFYHSKSFAAAKRRDGPADWGG